MYFNIYHPCSDSYYKHTSHHVCIPQSVVYLHRATMLKDRATKWRTLEKSVRMWK